MSGIAETAVAMRPESSTGPYEKLKPGPGMPVAVVAEHQCARIEAAMAEIVAEKGYRGVTVRQVTQRASVSSRAFYQHYSSKEECFLSTHESIVRRITRKVLAVQADADDWEERLRTTFGAFFDEFTRDPDAARLLLVEAYVAGSLALDQVRAAERTFETRIAECFTREINDLEPPPQLARGIVAGMMSVARFRLHSDDAQSLEGLAEQLTAWASSAFAAYSSNTSKSHSEVTSRAISNDFLNRLDLGCLRGTTSNSHSLIVNALTKLATLEGYETMTVRKVRTSAGASSKKFNSCFAGIADCFQQAVSIYITNFALLAEGDVKEEAPIALLCQAVADDPAFATLCFVDIFSPGGELGLESLRRLTKTIAGLPPHDARTPVAADATAGAVWGVMREEVVCGRGAQLPRLVCALELFGAVSSKKRATSRIPTIDRIPQLAAVGA